MSKINIDLKLTPNILILSGIKSNKDILIITAAANDNMEMVIYGGSNESGPIDDKLWILKLGNQNEEIWSEITTIGPRPGPRYGYSLIFMKPFFILFGGVKLKKETNELWILKIWKK